MTDVVEQTQEQQAAETAEGEAAFEAGFGSARGEEPPEPKVEPKAEVAPKAEVKTPPKDDWEGVPLVVRKSLEGITTKLGAIDALTHEVKSGTGRIAAIQRDLEAAKAAAKTVQVAPTQTQITDAAKAADKWNRLKEDFPDWAEAVDERLASERAELLKKVPQAQAVDVNGLKTTVAQLIEQSSARAEQRAREFVRVDMKHEDWENTVRTNEFGEWLKAQAPEKQALADSDKAKDAITLLDDYQKHVEAKAAQEKRQSRLQAAIPAKGAPKGGPSEPSDDEALIAGFYSVRPKAA